MNGMNNSNDDTVECPLCMEPLEVDDLNFYPCTCGYQICRFCWHRIRTDENELCPACRKAYPENPADFTPLSQEQISALKAEKRQRDQQRKQKITENRKHLANVRVVQKNLVFVVGLPPRLADPDILKRHEYFGKYGKIHKVVINPSTTYAGVQGPSASAYVTYLLNNDSLRAIQSVNNIMIDGRLIKTSLGTTKYCSHFMKNQQCPKPDCMYLHELGDTEASFTKEEMHQGKHQEYEKRLHDALIAQSQQPTISPVNDGVTGKTETSKTSTNITINGPIQSKEAWPSLSVSPINKENKMNGKIGGNNNNKEASTKKTKTEKLKGNKNNQNKNNNNSHTTNSNNKTNSNKEQTDLTDKQKLQLNHINIEDEINSLGDIENDALSNDGKTDTPSLSSTSSSNNDDSGTVSDSASGKSSPGTFPDNQNVITTSSSSSSSSSSCHQQQVKQQNKTNLEKSHLANNESTSTLFGNDIKSTTNGINLSNIMDSSARFSKLSIFDDNNSFFSTNSFQPFYKNDGNINSNTSNGLSSSQLPDLLNGTESDDTDREQRETKLLLKGLNGFHPQINSLNNDNTDTNLLPLNTTEDWEAAFKYVMMKNNKQIEDQQEELIRSQEIQKRNNIANNMGIQHLHNSHGIGDYNTTPDYMHRLSQSTFLQQQQQQQQQQHQQQQQQQQRIHNGLHLTPDNLGHIYAGNMSKFFDFHKNQQNQNQFIQTNGHSNGPLSEHSMTNLLDNNRINQHYLEHQHSNNGLIGQQQKQRMINKYEQLGGSNNHNLILNNQQQQQNRIHNHFTQQNTLVDDDLGFDPFIETQKALAELMENENVQSQLNHSKLLDNCQRTRMPPPGFNHMNAFGFGVPRAQGSKILPFMNMGNNAQSPQTNWTQHMNFQQQSKDQQHSHQSQQQQQNNQHNNKTSYGSMPDWTALDPAIVSYRQFPSFMSGPPQQQQLNQQHNAADMYMPQLNQQQQQQQQQLQQQQGQGFGHHGLNLQSSIINQQQQNSPAQVNYSHTNWLNTDQNIYMNNLTNGFTNNFDKFSIPMPPGFQNNVAGNKQQKTECIN